MPGAAFSRAKYLRATSGSSVRGLRVSGAVYAGGDRPNIAYERRRYAARVGNNPFRTAPQRLTPVSAAAHRDYNIVARHRAGRVPWMTASQARHRQYHYFKPHRGGRLHL